MKFNEENINKLREGKATLVADHSNPELMNKVLNYIFPMYENIYHKLPKRRYYYFTIYKSLVTFNYSTIGELTELKDFFIEDASNQFIPRDEVKNLHKSVLELNESGLMNSYIYSKQPKTAEERDRIIEQLAFQIRSLNLMEFKKDLPSELSLSTIDLNTKEEVLIKLLRMRDVYRDGWVSDMEDSNQSKWVVFSHISGLIVADNYFSSSSFSFKDKETAEMFLNNFKEELESVKKLIS